MRGWRCIGCGQYLHRARSFPPARVPAEQALRPARIAAPIRSADPRAWLNTASHRQDRCADSIRRRRNKACRFAAARDDYAETNLYHAPATAPSIRHRRHPALCRTRRKPQIDRQQGCLLMERRCFLETCAAVLVAVASQTLAQRQAAARSSRSIVIDPQPLFEFSPSFYMQFMEPLGTTDGSVEAAWDYEVDDWRKDFVDLTRMLAPDVIRYGGLLSRYYKWREGVGPASERPWMRNYEWGGKETNRVGTAELVDLCERVGAAPLYCVNFLGDGVRAYASTPEGDRTGSAEEAAEWVSYCNDPSHALRRAHGHPRPYDVKLWQIGNETSYGDATFARDRAIESTVEFARAMRARDARIRLIGWGDSGWAGELTRRAGEHIDYVAVHMMQQRPLRADTVLDSLAYQRAPERAWEELHEMLGARVERKLLALEAQLEAAGASHPIAITEGHLSLAPRNINPLLSEWLVGAYYARQLNLYARHGARVRMCTVADFNGTRWTTNAVLHEMPRGASYLLPAGAVMQLFKGHQGAHGVAVRSAPGGLDVSASRSGDEVLLHVANLSYVDSVPADFVVEGMAVAGGEVHEIAPQDPRASASSRDMRVFAPRVIRLTADPAMVWHFPARSVSAVRLQCSRA
jgi:alpha-L-arabinofuranosidase